jgi:hypothetical protein
MSLKMFHLIFITAASAMAVGFGLWMLRDYRAPGGSAGDLWWAITGFVVGAGLLVYERYFLKKLKKISYL